MGESPELLRTLVDGYSCPWGWVNGDRWLSIQRGRRLQIGGLRLMGTTYYLYRNRGSVVSTYQLSDTATITSGTSLTVCRNRGIHWRHGRWPPDVTFLRAGDRAIRCWINKLVDKIPRFRITLNNPPAGIKVRLWGIHRIAFDQGGQLP